MSERPRVAVVGMGGYGAHHQRAVLELERRGVLELVATCDPNRRVHEKARVEFQLAERAVATYYDFAEMMARESDAIDLLTVAAPIGLHRPMHAAGAAAGLAVYLEKPPTLDPRALAAMIALDDRARWRALVGFNFILEPTRRRLKARLLAGEFGALCSVSFVALWPRSSAYFARAPWAGRLRDDQGNLILDSCLGNATAHFTHNLLFWTGAGELDSWGCPTRVEAQLYRAHLIEGADTCFVRGATERATPFRIAVTHTGSSTPRQLETVECERATISYDAYGDVRVHWRDGRLEPIEREPHDPLQSNYLDYVAYISGAKARPHTTLRDSEPFVHLNASSYLSSRRIHAFPARLVERASDPSAEGDERGGHFVVVQGVAQSMESFAQSGEFPDFGLGEARVRVSASPELLGELDACVTAIATVTSTSADAQP